MDFRLEDDRFSHAYDVWRELGAEPVAGGFGATTSVADRSATAPAAGEPVASFAPPATPIGGKTRKQGLRARISRVLLALAIAPLPSLAVVSLVIKALRSA